MKENYTQSNLIYSSKYIGLKNGRDAICRSYAQNWLQPTSMAFKTFLFIIIMLY